MAGERKQLTVIFAEIREFGSDSLISFLSNLTGDVGFVKIYTFLGF
jgi:hypothetical protein